MAAAMVTQKILKRGLFYNVRAFGRHGLCSATSCQHVFETWRVNALHAKTAQWDLVLLQVTSPLIRVREVIVELADPLLLSRYKETAKANEKQLQTSVHA